jgi:hypothetical protein
MAFWNLASVEPKRNFRYKVIFGGDLGQDDASKETAKSQISIFASKVSKPSYTISTQEYQYLNHKFKYPGRVEWQDIKMTFTDAGGSSGILDIAQTMMSAVAAAGYQIPTSTSDLKTISKELANKQVGSKLTIQQLNAAGEAIETWLVYNAFFTDVAFSELSYGSDDLSTVDVTVKYDYAKLQVGSGTAAILLPR